MSKRTIAPVHQVPMLVAHLRRFGFHLHKRTESGTRYLKIQESPFRLRISDHQWSGWNTRRYPDVVHNVIVDQAKTPSELEELAWTIAMRFVLRVRLRLGLVGDGRPRGFPAQHREAA